MPITFELYAEWQWNLAHFEINLCWEDANNSFKNDGSILLKSAKIKYTARMP